VQYLCSRYWVPVRSQIAYWLHSTWSAFIVANWIGNQHPDGLTITLVIKFIID
jgi:hypothetical protein